MTMKRQGITFNLIITRVDRGEATQPASQNLHTGATVALHTISIQTTVSRFADPIDPPKVIIPEGSMETQRDNNSQKEAWHAY